ncbi:MAG: ComEC/Rec2 family competence protein, partial [Clostridium sp.]
EVFDKNGRHIETKDVDDNYLYVKYLNVGNADCHFIKLPSGETVLIDTGDVSTREQLVDFLNEQDLKTKKDKKYIDYVVITHGHSDHIGGLEAVLENFKVGKIYMPKNAAMEKWHSGLKVSDKVTQADIDMIKYDYDVYNSAVKAAKNAGLKFIDPKKGDYIDSNKILQFVQSGKDFGPVGSQDNVGKYWGINDNSAIVYLNYGDFQCLFTGDIEWTAEKDFWTNNLLDRKEVDILKVPHHGNDTSSTGDFLKYVNASVGIINRSKESIKKNEAYNNLITNGVTIYETSESTNGGISVYSTEDNWSMADIAYSQE